MPTFGTTAPNTTGTAFDGIQQVAFFTPADLSVTSIVWDIGGSGNFTFRIDGVVVNTFVGVSGTGVEMLTGPITLTRGEHEFSLTRTSGSNSWRYLSSNTFVDGWFHLGHWQSAGGGETAGVRITATPDSNWVYDEIGDEPWEISGTLRATYTWDVTFAHPLMLRGLSIGQTGFNSLELLIDGIVVGMNSGSAGTQTSFSTPGGQDGSWIDCDPNFLVTQGAHTIQIRPVGGGSFTGLAYVVNDTGDAVPSVDETFTETEFVEDTTFHTFVAVRWHFTALPPEIDSSSLSHLSLGPTLVGMSVSRLPIAEPEPPSMSVTSGLTVWLRPEEVAGIADEGAVTTWPAATPAVLNATQEGAGNPTIEASAAINGHNPVYFPGPQANRLEVNAASAAGGASAGTLLIVCDRLSGNGAAVQATSQSTSASTAAHWPWTDNQTYDRNLHTSRWAAAFTELGGGAVNTVMVTSDSTDGWRFRVEGTQYASRTHSWPTMNEFALGGWVANGYYAWEGYIYEVLYWTRVLSSAERWSVHDYLNYKYSLTLPTS